MPSTSLGPAGRAGRPKAEAEFVAAVLAGGIRWPRAESVHPITSKAREFPMDACSHRPMEPIRARATTASAARRSGCATGEGVVRDSAPDPWQETLWLAGLSQTAVVLPP